MGQGLELEERASLKIKYSTLGSLELQHQEQVEGVGDISKGCLV